MNRFTNLAVAGAIAVSGVMGGVIGAAMVGASAASNATPAAATAPAAPAAGTFHSNEDPSHEAGESAAREAAENNGTATFGPGGGGVPPAQ